MLEIGPGPERLPGFETVNAVRTPYTDHVADARALPFADASYDLVYSSHCIEHVEWYEVEATIKEWVRVLKPGGLLEVHTVNALPLLKAIVEIEEAGNTELRAGKWRSDLHRFDPYLWAVGRIMCYAKKGDGGLNNHRAILTPSFLRRCMKRAGLSQIQDAGEPRGRKKHASINMGLMGVKGKFSKFSLPSHGFGDARCGLDPKALQPEFVGFPDSPSEEQ